MSEAVEDLRAMDMCSVNAFEKIILREFEKGESTVKTIIKILNEAERLASAPKRDDEQLLRYCVSLADAYSKTQEGGYDAWKKTANAIIAKDRLSEPLLRYIRMLNG